MALDTAAVTQQLDTYRAILTSLRTQLQRARANADATAEAIVRARVTSILRDVTALHAALRAAEAPGAVMMGLADVSDTALGIARDVGGVAGDVLAAAGQVAGGLGKVANVLPLVLLGLVAVLGIGLFKGTLRASLRR